MSLGKELAKVSENNLNAKLDKIWETLKIQLKEFVVDKTKREYETKFALEHGDGKELIDLFTKKCSENDLTISGKIETSDGHFLGEASRYYKFTVRW